MLKNKSLKTKKCKNCKCSFIPKQPLQLVCSYKCAADKAKKEALKERKSETKSLKEKLTSTSELKKKLEKVINEICRELDKGFACICCGSIDGKGQAGHFHSVGSSPEIRFNLNNIHKCCYRCNVELSGNITGFILGLRQRYGLEYSEFVLTELKAEKQKKYTGYMLRGHIEKAKEFLKELRTMEFDEYDKSDLMFLREIANKTIFGKDHFINYSDKFRGQIQEL